MERTLGKEEMISLSEIKSAMIVDNDKHWAFGRNAGWGLAGAVTLGPLGLLAGTLLTGNVKEQVVAVGFKDGRKAVISGKKNKLAPIVASGFVAY